MASSENIFEEIGHGIKVAAEDVAHIVVVAVEYPVKAEKVIAALITDYPNLKTILTQLVVDSKAVGTDVLKVIEEKGLNLTDDLATWTAAKAFFEYVVNTVTPAIESAYGDLTQAESNTSSSVNTTSTTTETVSAS